MKYRISKYSPKNRNLQDVYLKNDWTSISDIGKTFEGNLLTKENYLKTESLYWQITKQMIDLCSIEKMEMQGLEIDEKNSIKHLPEEFKLTTKKTFESLKLKNGEKYSIDLIEKIFRLVLREVFWCKLLGENETYLHFGYDFYLYFGSNLSFMVYEIPVGIYIEEMESPYL